MALQPGIHVNMLFPTPEIVQKYYVPIIYTACRTCYSEEMPMKIWERIEAGKVPDEKMKQLVRTVVASGHGTTIEHINFTFGIGNVTRTLTHQLVRHRIGVAFDQQSQRYVKYKHPDVTVPKSISDDPELAAKFTSHIQDGFDLYKDLVDHKVPAEDARFVFPNATRTNLIMTVNLRELIHMCDLRLCTLAQWEIQVLFREIKREVRQASPFLASFLHPKCVSLGYCDEARNEDEHCKIRPHKNTVMRVFQEHRQADLQRKRGTLLPMAQVVPEPVGAGLDESAPTNLEIIA